MWYKQSAIVIGLLLATLSTAQACLLNHELVPTDVADADSVVIADVQNYMVVDDYARFELAVESVLKGNPPAIIPVGWTNSTFGNRKMMSGLHLVALLKPDTPFTIWGPPGTNARYQPAPDRTKMNVLQRFCTTAFILPVRDRKVSEILAVLAK